MKYIYLFTTLLFQFIFQPTYSQIADTTGIQIHTWLDWENAWALHSGEKKKELLNNMRDAGINIIQSDFSQNSFLQMTDTLKFKVLAGKTNNLNWIQYYSEGKYKLWSVKDQFTSNDYLRWDSNIMQPIENNYIRLKPDSAYKIRKLTWGPYFEQIQTHGIKLDSTDEDRIRYNLKLRVRLELGNLGDPLSQTDTILRFQIKTSKLGTGWSFGCSKVIFDTLLTKQRFTNFQDFEELLFQYDLSSPPCNESIPSIGSGKTSINGSFPQSRDYVSYELTWMGNRKYTITIDYIKEYDERGRQLIEGSTSPSINIAKQLSSVTGHTSSIYAWHLIDEPNNIDSYLPLKRVQYLVDSLSSNTQKVYFPMMGHWDGVWDNKNNPWGTYHLNPWKEIEKVFGKNNALFTQDFYYYDWPNGTYLPYWVNPDSIKLANIRMAAYENYRNAYQLNENFGVSLQCGEIHIPGIAEERNITGREFLYEANLALLFGAKLLSLYTYLAQVDTNKPNAGFTFHGIVDHFNDKFIYTDKYNILRYTLNPRLKGLMGKTLKGLRNLQSEGDDLKYLNIDLNRNYYYITSINYQEGDNCFNSNSPVANEGYDLGFFRDDEIQNLSYVNNYFMLIRRAYQKNKNCPLKISLNISDLHKINWRAEDLRDSSVRYVHKSGYLITSIDTGDAVLYKLSPVVISGGNIVYDETISLPTTLKYNPLIVKNGARLTIKSTYYVNQKIIVEPGGELYIAPGGVLQFNSSDSLFVYGKLTAAGTASNRSIIKTYSSNFRFGTITFIGTNSSSSVLKNADVNYTTSISLLNGANILIDSCNIFKPYNGIYIYNSSPIITNNTIIEPIMHGIFGEASGLNPVIRKNYIYKAPSTWTGSGVWLYNGSVPHILENKINNFYYGAIFTGSTAFFWQTLTPNPNNCIHINIYGLYANSSSVFAGYTNGLGGYNSIHSNTAQDGMSTNYSILNAANNYWASQTPRAWNDNTSQMDVSLPLTTEVCENASTETELPTDQGMLQGLSLESQGQIDGAISFYKNLITTEQAPSFAINNLEKIRQKYSRNELHGYFKQLLTKNKLKPLVYNTLASIAVKNGETDTALALYGYLADNYQGFISYQAKVRKFYTLLNEKKNKVLAQNVLNELKSYNFTDEYMKMELATAESFLTEHTGMLQKNSAAGNSEELETYQLYMNYPNPFNPSTNIRYYIPQSSWVTIKVYDVLGREVQTLVDEMKETGMHNIIFDGKHLSSGMYIYQFRSGKYILSRKMLLIK